MAPGLGSRCRRGVAAVRAAHVFEEIVVRVQHHHVLPITERRAIRFHGAPEGGELRIAAKCIGINICGRLLDGYHASINVRNGIRK